MKKRVPRGYWMDIDNILKILIPITDKLGYYPSQIELSHRMLHSLINAVKNYHGGYKRIAGILGVPTAVEFHKSQLRDWDRFVQEIKPLVKERGYLPSHAELQKEKRGDLNRAIRYVHGGTKAVARKMGVKTYNEYYNLHDCGNWTREKVLLEYKEMLVQHMFGHWPSPADMKGIGYGALHTAIGTTFGGHNKFRKLIEEEGITLPKKTWPLDHLIPFETKYAITDEVFTEGELKYAFLGWIAADGSIVDKKNDKTIELCLNKLDKGILETIRDRISPDRPIHDKKHAVNPSHDACRLKFNDRRVFDMVAHYISGHHKSHTLVWPTDIPDEHVSHFIRGYVEGDGTIGVVHYQKPVQGKKRHYYKTRLRILGTMAFLTGLTMTVHRLIGIEPVKASQKGKENVFEIQYGGKNADTILTRLYNGATIYLARKKLVWDFIRTAPQNVLAKNYGTPAGRYNKLAKEGKLRLHSNTDPDKGLKYVLPRSRQLTHRRIEAAIQGRHSR